MPGTLDLSVDLALAGLAVGSAAALSGVGLVVTHRATGVLNLAQGAQATATAYLLRELVVVRHWPLAPAAAFCLLVAAPALGVLLDLAVFRPLRRRDAGPAESMVAGIGVFVLLIGVIVLIWGTTPFGDAPALVPATVMARPAGHPLRLDTVVQLAVVLGLAGGVGLVERHTAFGVRLRAVVDDRRLARLAGIDADRISAAGWAFGSFTAGLVGVLLAPLLLLDPYGLPLLVTATMAVAVAARLRSLPVAVATGLALGVAQSELARLRPGGQLLPLAQAVQTNLFVVALLVAALLPWGRGQDGPGLAAPGGRAGRRGSSAARTACAVLLLLPLGFRPEDLRHALLVPALALVLLSLVVVTGYGGQVSLGQAGYAGLGALGTALLMSGQVPGVPMLPAVPALLLAVAATVPLGLLTGWPAVRRRGLALALVTFAVGTALSRLVFDQPYATNGLTVSRLGLPADDRGFYLVELVLLGAGLLLVRTLHRGRPGRSLTAMRDHQAGASAAGVDVPRLKVLVFMAGAGLAALGGGLTALAEQGFDATAFDPVRSLLWFATVVVAGADSATGAVLAAALLTGLDAGTLPGVSAVVVGALATAIGRLPGGLAGLARRLADRPAPGLTPLGERLRRRIAERSR
ncbi:ABC transporter permease [Kitasatospora sp. NBC_00240]|uniref:ABC transporter permease n=1 Tax=Kitasatospora sp. NBC_00240 TaxID=2903567 RepID=UPI002B1E3E2D|nr:ABC transporter permease [Kitasatospora sp. NBC_00240]